MGERGLELMARRGRERRAFGGPLAANPAFQAAYASARIRLDAARLVVLDAAHALDLHGAKQARRAAAGPEQAGSSGGRARPALGSPEACQRLCSVCRRAAAYESAEHTRAQWRQACCLVVYLEFMCYGSPCAQRARARS